MYTRVRVPEPVQYGTVPLLLPQPRLGVVVPASGVTVRTVWYGTVQTFVRSLPHETAMVM